MPLYYPSFDLLRRPFPFFNGVGKQIEPMFRVEEWTTKAKTSMKMERIYQTQKAECNNSKENTVKLGSAAAEQARDIAHHLLECTAGWRTVAAVKGRRMHRTKGEREAEGIRV